MTESGQARVPDLGARFEWLAHLGEGGHGRVELAFDRRRNARVALKLLARAAHGGALLKHEFRILRDLSSPHLVSMLELIIEPRLECLVLEYVDGVDLLSHLGGAGDSVEQTRAATLATGVTRRVDPGVGSRVPADAMAAVFAQLLDALAFLDGAGLVHGDLKPANIFVERGSGRLVLLDFGIARLVSAASGTRAVGTPLYMAPEQFTGEPLTGATDRYALGVLLYRALSGRFPFVGTAAQLARAKQGAPEPFGDGPLERVTLGLLAPDPQDRPTLDAVRRALSPSVVAPRTPVVTNAPSLPLVGRGEVLARLRAVLVEETPSVALLVGGAGMGKTAILDEVARDLGPRALRARCYANESLRWNAIDGLVDALVGEGFRDDRDESALSRVFPSVRSSARAIPGTEVTPVDLVRTAVAELGQVLRRSDRVVIVDDVQWADTDAVSFLVELMRVEPRLRFVLSARGPDTTSEIVTIAIELAPRVVTTIPVEPLSLDETAELARRVLAAAVEPELVQRVTAGVPFLVERLCLRARQLGRAFRTVEEAEALLALQDGDVDAPSQGLLGLLAVNGSPIALEIASHLLGDAVHAAIRGLAIARIVRVENDLDERHGRVDVYHDHIRQRFLQGMSSDERRRAHAQLAEATFRLFPDRNDEIARHLFGAEDDRAYGYARKAAADARHVFAFERAIAWLLSALQEPALGDALKRELSLELANAMRFGERHAEAAAILDSVARSAGDAEAVELRLDAASQWLTAGELVRGISAMRSLARDSGLAELELGATPLKLLRERLRLAFRGLDPPATPAPARAGDTRLEVDVAWTLSGCLGLVDPLRAAFVHSLVTARALDLGEPARLQRMLAGEAVLHGAFGTWTRKRTFAILERVEQLADRLDDHARGLALASRSVAHIQAGEFEAGIGPLFEGLGLLGRHPKTVGWELMTTRHFYLHALYYLGRFSELSAYIEEEYRVSRLRQNRHRTSDVSLGHAALVCLLTHGRQVALQRVTEANEFWADVGTNLQSYYACVAESLMALWDGDGLGAWRAYREGPRGSFPMQLLLPEGLRIDMLHNVGRAAIARAISSRSFSHIAVALALTAALGVEPQAHAGPLARLQLAGMARAFGGIELSRKLAGKAEADLLSQKIVGYAAAAAAMRGVRFDPAPLSDLGVKHARQLAGVLAPGALASDRG